MKKFKLQIYLHILGIGSASGLLHHNTSLFLISDSSSFLYEYHLETDFLEKHALFENAQTNILKKDKPDFEAITKKENELFIIGSGSTENRKKQITFHLQEKTITCEELENLYTKFIKTAKIQANDLNIEGIIALPNKTLFFQRGNSLSSKNGIFIQYKDKRKVEFKEIVLPKIKTVLATFTDAILVDSTIYFLASAEDTNSTYDDGLVMGSLIGQISLDNLAILETQIISESHKFEGISLLQHTNTEIEFLLCEDKDNDVLETTIYKLKLNK